MGQYIIEHMYECMERFSEPVRDWFNHAFERPTPTQIAAWPAIQSGKHALVVAPTGSGKPQRTATPNGSRSSRCSDDKAGRGVRVLYISPLKALGVDVAQNLQRPLDGIAQRITDDGGSPDTIRVAIRSGDSTPQERRKIVAHPPDILVTTPESLYLMLTSKARSILTSVRTVIVDEVHAVAGAKRGAHLALSLERLERLAGGPVQRIGLSATVHPPEEAARFLCGDRPVAIVNPSAEPHMLLRVVEPLKDMWDLSSDQAASRAGAVHASHEPQRISGVTAAMEQLARRKGIVKDSVLGGLPDDAASEDQRPGASIWPAIERSVLDQVLSHRTTLVFVNSRGLAEKLTARLNDLYVEGSSALRQADRPYGSGSSYDAVVGSSTMLTGSHDDGDVIAMAHHGSVSKDRRKRIEEDLNHGRLRCVVATSKSGTWY